MINVRKALKRRLRTKPYPYQVEGVRFVETSLVRGRTLIADDMGLGKTLQALGWSSIAPGDKRPVICVVPATVKVNWQREWKLHAGLKSYICEGKLTKREEDYDATKKRLRSLYRRKKWRTMSKRQRATAVRNAWKAFDKKRKEVRRKLREIRGKDILIINYEILEFWADALLELKPRVIIMDECHYIMNRTAKRTLACMKVGKRCRYRIALSGTPITNRPVEFWPVLHILYPKRFASFSEYAWRYCEPRHTRWGWVFDGKSNLKELNRRCRPFMIRRLKHKVLKDLPKKQRIVIPIDITNRKQYTRARDNFVEWLADKEGMRAVQRAKGAMTLVRLGKLKKLAAEGKLKTVIQWIEDYFAETDEKLVVFAIHRTIIQALKKRFPNAAMITGSTPVGQRSAQVDRFRKKRSVRLFIGQLKAAGVGVDGLQRVCSTTLTLELPWNEAALVQAEDRVLRIGQKHGVRNYYLVAEGTIEEWLLEILQEKKIVVDEVLEGKSDKGRGSLLSQLERLLK